MFNSVRLSPLNDLLQGLSMVDSVERLGIDRHFKNEIKSALDYVYRSVTVALTVGNGDNNSPVDRILDPIN